MLPARSVAVRTASAGAPGRRRASSAASSRWSRSSSSHSGRARRPRSVPRRRLAHSRSALFDIQMDYSLFRLDVKWKTRFRPARRPGLSLARGADSDTEIPSCRSSRSASSRGMAGHLPAGRGARADRRGNSLSRVDPAAARAALGSGAGGRRHRRPLRARARDSRVHAGLLRDGRSVWRRRAGDAIAVELDPPARRVQPAKCCARGPPSRPRSRRTSPSRNRRRWRSCLWSSWRGRRSFSLATRGACGRRSGRSPRAYGLADGVGDQPSEATV